VTSDMTSPNTEKLQDHLTARCKQRNGGDVAVCPQKNFRYRSTTLKQIDVGPGSWLSRGATV
jgi:hypothetical protein